MEPEPPHPPSQPRRDFAPWCPALALLAALAACGDEARRALDAQAAANGTAGPPNNGQGGRSGGGR